MVTKASFSTTSTKQTLTGSLLSPVVPASSWAEVAEPQPESARPSVRQSTSAQIRPPRRPFLGKRLGLGVVGFIARSFLGPVAPDPWGRA